MDFLTLTRPIPVRPERSEAESKDALMLPRLFGGSLSRLTVFGR